MRAYCLIRSQPHYRHDAFIAGLTAAGYDVATSAPSRGAPGQVLVIWNRYGTNEIVADRFEAAGGTVLVAENGYLGRDSQARRCYALARHGHNGSGDWSAGDSERFERLGVEIKPWRTQGEHVLVCPNRPFGMRGFEMPVHWANECAARLRRHTRRPLRIRPHPGNAPAAVPLERDLENCWAVVIWASSAGVHALAAGIPVICEAPWWICKSATGARLETVDAPMMPHRQGAFERLAWAQWTVEEIAGGEPFRRLLAEKGSK